MKMNPATCRVAKIKQITPRSKAPVKGGTVGAIPLMVNAIDAVMTDSVANALEVARRKEGTLSNCFLSHDGEYVKCAHIRLEEHEDGIVRRSIVDNLLNTLPASNLIPSP